MRTALRPLTDVPRKPLLPVRGGERIKPERRAREVEALDLEHRLGGQVRHHLGDVSSRECGQIAVDNGKGDIPVEDGLRRRRRFRCRTRGDIGRVRHIGVAP